MNFSEGGRWLYCMVGPDGAGPWCRLDFKKIVPYQSFTAANGFCDENGNENPDFPVMQWKTEFYETSSGAKIVVEITFTSEADMEKIIEMGIEEGFTAALGNLNELLAK